MDDLINFCSEIDCLIRKYKTAYTHIPKKDLSKQGSISLLQNTEIEFEIEEEGKSEDSKKNPVESVSLESLIACPLLSDKDHQSILKHLNSFNTEFDVSLQNKVVLQGIYDSLAALVLIFNFLKNDKNCILEQLYPILDFLGKKNEIGKISRTVEIVEIVDGLKKIQKKIASMIWSQILNQIAFLTAQTVENQYKNSFKGNLHKKFDLKDLYQLVCPEFLSETAQKICGDSFKTRLALVHSLGLITEFNQESLCSEFFVDFGKFMQLAFMTKFDQLHTIALLNQKNKGVFIKRIQQEGNPKATFMGGMCASVVLETAENYQKLNVQSKKIKSNMTKNVGLFSLFLDSILRGKRPLSLPLCFLLGGDHPLTSHSVLLQFHYHLLLRNSKSQSSVLFFDSESESGSEFESNIILKIIYFFMGLEKLLSDPLLIETIQKPKNVGSVLICLRSHHSEVRDHILGVSKLGTGSYRFLDPNVGEFDFGSLKTMGQWFSEYWEELRYSDTYKSMFAKRIEVNKVNFKDELDFFETVQYYWHGAIAYPIYLDPELPPVRFVSPRARMRI